MDDASRPTAAAATPVISWADTPTAKHQHPSVCPQWRTARHVLALLLLLAASGSTVLVRGQNVTARVSTSGQLHRFLSKSNGTAYLTGRRVYYLNQTYITQASLIGTTPGGVFLLPSPTAPSKQQPGLVYASGHALLWGLNFLNFTRGPAVTIRGAASVTVANTTFLRGRNGAVVVRSNTGSTAFVNVTWAYNTRAVNGSSPLLLSSATRVTLSACRFLHNHAVTVMRVSNINTGDVDSDITSISRLVRSYAASLLLRGGAVRVMASTLSINGSVFYNNTSGEGGGLFITGASQVSITSSTFHLCSALYRGGAIFISDASAVLAVDRSTFRRNQAWGGNSTVRTPSGGAVYCSTQSSVSVSSSRFRENLSAMGGALYFIQMTAGVSAQLSVSGCLFGNNSATQTGGAVSMTLLALGKANVTSCTFFNNSCVGQGSYLNLGNGGGVYASLTTTSSSSPTRLGVRDCYFARNLADLGAAVSTQSSGSTAVTSVTVLVDQCVLVANTALQKGALQVHQNYGRAVISNTLITANVADNVVRIIGAFSSAIMRGCRVLSNTHRNTTSRVSSTIYIQPPALCVSVSGYYPVLIQSSYIQQNTAGFGAIAYTPCATLTVTGVSFLGNTPRDIYYHNTSPTKSASFTCTTTATTAVSAPTTCSGTSQPTSAPTNQPSRSPSSASPTLLPTLGPTLIPGTTLPPTLAPSRLPTRPPTKLPTRSPVSGSVKVTALAVSPSGSVSSPWRPANATMVLSPGGKLWLHAVASAGGCEWSSPNASRMASQLSVTGADLVLMGLGLTPGATYTMTVQATSFSGVRSTVGVYINQAPSGGSVGVLPARGVALVTSFRITAGGWSDAEDDLPLTYAFRAWPSQDQEIALAAESNRSAIKVTLPSGSGMTVGALIADALGATTTSTAAAQLQVSSTPIAVLVAKVSALTSSNSSSSSSSAALLVAFEASSRLSAGSANLTAANATALATQVLAVIADVASSNGSRTLDLGVAETAASCLSLLATLSASAASSSWPSDPSDPSGSSSAAALPSLELLAVLEAVVESAPSASTTLGTSAVSTVSSLITTGLLSSSRCSDASDTSRGIDRVLNGLTSLAAEALVPGQGGATFTAPQLALGISKQTPATLSSGLDVSIAAGTANTTLRLPPSLLRNQSACSGRVSLQTIAWTADRFGCAAASPSSSSRTTSVSLLSDCSGSEGETLRVRHLPEPISLTYRFSTRPRPPQHLNCSLGNRSVIAVQCSYSGGSTRTLLLNCDGMQPRAAYSCPRLVRCAYWNASLARWATEGKAVEVMGGQATCYHDHMTDFTVVDDSVANIITTLMTAQDLNREFLERHLGVIITVALLYLTFAFGLAFLRFRRTAESIMYMREIPLTRMYRSILTHLQLLNKDMKKAVDRLPTSTHKDFQTHWFGDTSTAFINSKNTATRVAPTITSTGTAAGTVSFLELSDQADELQQQQEDLPPSSPRYEATWQEIAVSVREARIKIIWRLMQQSKVSTLFQHLRGENAPVEDEADAAVLTRSQRKPLNQISTVQSWLLGFIRSLTLLFVAVVSTPPDVASLRSQWLALVKSQYSFKLVFSTFSSSVQQSIVSEPVCRVIEWLLLVINKETAVKTTISELIVTRDLDFALPADRVSAGPLYVPMLRIALLQLELVMISLRQEAAEYAMQGSFGGKAAGKKGLSMLSRERQMRSLAKLIHRCKEQLREEYRLQKMERSTLVSKQLRSTWNPFKRAYIWLSNLWKRPEAFEFSPLESVDAKAKISSAYDDWVLNHVLRKSWLRRTYYSLFVAELRDHVAGQEFFLFSWRLVRCDLAVVLYLLFISFYTVLLSATLTANVVNNTIFNAAAGFIVDALFLEPALSIVQGRVSLRIGEDISRELAERHVEFLIYYEKLTGGADDIMAQTGTDPLAETTPSPARAVEVSNPILCLTDWANDTETLTASSTIGNTTARTGRGGREDDMDDLEDLEEEEEKEGEDDDDDDDDEEEVVIRSFARKGPSLLPKPAQQAGTGYKKGLPRPAEHGGSRYATASAAVRASPAKTAKRRHDPDDYDDEGVEVSRLSDI